MRPARSGNPGAAPRPFVPRPLASSAAALRSWIHPHHATRRSGCDTGVGPAGGGGWFPPRPNGRCESLLACRVVDQEARMADSFPRQYARTQGFNLGLPRAFRVAPDGSRVAFTRSPAGDDRLAGLWVYDAAADAERLVFDPAPAGGER